MKRSGENHERLVHAAAELFWRSGYAATSLADVAEAAEVPVGNVYYYFRAKAALAESVSALMDREMAAALAGITARHTAPAARLAALIDLLSATNASRTARGCPLAAACRGFREAAPDASAIAAGAFRRLREWLREEFSGAGLGEEAAERRADDWLTRWQGAISLAHALSDQAILDRAMADLRREARTVGTSK